MTIEQQNVDALKKVYALWNKDKQTAFHHWLGLMDDNIQWRSLAEGAPGMEFTCARCSKAEVVQYFEQLARDWEMISYDADEFIAQGDRVVMVGRCAWRHLKTKKDVSTPKVDIFRMKNGKVVDFFELYDTAAALEATR